MRANKNRPPYTVVTAISLVIAACGGNATPDAESAGDQSALIIDDPVQASGDSRELVVSEQGTAKKTIVRCFCDSLYRSTLLFYHFIESDAVLVIEFDNRFADFPAKGVVNLFDSEATPEDIGQWINNQHSDGLFIQPAEPFRAIDIPGTEIAITSSAFVENISGYSGDEYEKFQVEFTVGNHFENRVLFLNGFSDQTEIYLQTAESSFTD